jgi:peptide/nickel transport system substrate-binding protein
MRCIHELVGRTVGAFAFALIGLQPCGAAEPVPRDGGSLIMATRAQVQGFDPLTTRAANRETTMAGALLFSSFFTLDEKGDRVPDLATSLDSSPGGLTWRLKLRPGLKFSNGAPYTARDVAHHFQRILDPAKNQAFAAALGALKEAVAIDDATVEFRLAYPWARPTASSSGRCPPSTRTAPDPTSTAVRSAPVPTG